MSMTDAKLRRTFGTALDGSSDTPKDDMKNVVTLDVPLYPQSAHRLLPYAEQAAEEAEGLFAAGAIPRHVMIDLRNFSNQLAAHLQRVARGA